MFMVSAPILDGIFLLDALSFEQALIRIKNNDPTFDKVNIAGGLETRYVIDLANALSKNNIIKVLCICLATDVEESTSNYLGAVLAANNINIKHLWISSRGKINDSFKPILSHLKDSNIAVGVGILKGIGHKTLFRGLEGNNKIKWLLINKFNFKGEKSAVDYFIDFLNKNPQLEEIKIINCEGLRPGLINHLIAMIREKNNLINLEILQDINPEQEIALIESLKLNNVITYFNIDKERYPNLWDQIQLTITCNLELLGSASLKLRESKMLSSQELRILITHVNDLSTLSIFPKELRDEFLLDSARIKYLLERFSISPSLPFNVRLPDEIGPIINEYASIKHLIALNFREEVTQEISEAFLQHFERAPNLFKEFFLSHNMWLIIKALKSDMPFTEILANGQKLANDRKSAELITNHPKILGFLITRDQELLDNIIKNIINNDEYYALIKDNYKNIASIVAQTKLIQEERNSIESIPEEETKEEVVAVTESKTEEEITHPTLSDQKTNQNNQNGNKGSSLGLFCIDASIYDSDYNYPFDKASIYLKEQYFDKAFIYLKEKYIEYKSNTETQSNNKISISLSDLLYKSTISFKSLDFMVDTFRSINEPNAENAQKTLRDVIHLQSIFTGNNIYSMALSSIDIANQLDKGDVQEAGKQLIITMSYMALPTMLSFTGIPYLGLAYGAMITGYTGYHAINNAYSLYLEYGTVEWQLKSAEAYKNLYEALSYCYNEEQQIAGDDAVEIS